MDRGWRRRRRGGNVSMRTGGVVETPTVFSVRLEKKKNSARLWATARGDVRMG